MFEPSTLLAIFQQIPDVTIPGVPTEYMPQQSAQAVAALFDRIFPASIKLLAVTTVIGAALTVASPLVGEDGDKTNWAGFLKRIVVTVLLLVGLQFVFGNIIDLGHSIGQQIFPDQDVSKLNQQFAENANKVQQEKGVPADGKSGGVIQSIVEMVGVAQGNITIGIVGALSGIAFFATTIVINILWRVLVIILYITGPLIIITLPIPGLGQKLVTNWLAAVFQLSLWQVWFSICAFFVNTSDSIFKVTDDVGQTINHIDSIAHALIFTVLYIATPFFISAIFPISSFSSSASIGFLAGAKVLSSVLGKFGGIVGSKSKKPPKTPPRKAEAESKPEPVTA